MARKKLTESGSLMMNDKTYQFYYNRLMELAITTFEWKGLPSSIDERFLELILYTDGMGVVFNDDVMGLLSLQVMIGTPLDVYRIPVERRAYATNGYQQQLNIDNSVIVFNNNLRQNSMLGVEMYARRLYEIERTIDVNVIGQKTPVAILASENQRLVMKNFYEQYTGNEPFIFGDKDLDLKGIQVINTGAPFVSIELNQLKHEIWNEALTWLGISNANVNKKERLVTNEVTQNMGGVIAEKNTRLKARQKACEQINAMFNTDISVDYSDDVKMLQEQEGKEIE